MHRSVFHLASKKFFTKGIFNHVQATIFHYGSISLIDEPCRSAHLAAMDIAKRSGSILSYDPNLRLPLWPSEDAARSGIMSVWNLADIIKVLLFHNS